MAAMVGAGGGGSVEEVRARDWGDCVRASRGRAKGWSRWSRRSGWGVWEICVDAGKGNIRIQSVMVEMGNDIRVRAAVAGSDGGVFLQPDYSRGYILYDATVAMDV